VLEGRYRLIGATARRLGSTGGSATQFGSATSGWLCSITKRLARSPFCSVTVGAGTGPRTSKVSGMSTGATKIISE